MVALGKAPNHSLVERGGWERPSLGGGRYLNRVRGGGTLGGSGGVVEVADRGREVLSNYPKSGLKNT